MTWMNLENLLLSEISQSQRDKYFMIPVMRHQIHKDRKYKLAGAKWRG